MPRPTLPARLELENERRDGKGRITHHGGWVIVDRGKKRRTGCGPSDRAGAERALAAYLIASHTVEQKKPKRSLLAEDIACADVLATYAERKSDVADDAIVKAVARPKEMLASVERLLDFFGDMTLADVDTTSCHAFIRKRKTHAGARRDLETLQAAINMAIKDGKCREVVRVSLPDKGGAREGWLTRNEVAKIVRYCWRHQRSWRPPRGPNAGKLIKIKRWPYRHLIPWILTALYTASRSARIWTASYEEMPKRPWIDLETGTYHRMWRGEKATRKRAESIGIPPRLLGHMRRWQAGPLVDGKRTPRKYLVEWKGKPANPRLALIRVMREVLGEDHGIVLHSYRHTSVTWLVGKGVRIDKIAKFASMTESMIRKVYGHHHPDADVEVGEAFSSGGAGKRTRHQPRRFPAETPVEAGNSRE